MQWTPIRWTQIVNVERERDLEVVQVQIDKSKYYVLQILYYIVEE